MKISITPIAALRIWLFLLCASALVPVASSAQNMGGIGTMLAIDSSDGYTMPLIKSVMPNTPAAQSLKENSFIQKVNDINCKNKTIEEVVGLIRGNVGTNVKVTVSDDKPGKSTVDFNLVRASIQVPQPANIPAADPATSFYAGCEKTVKETRKQGHKIVKTYKSECGSYFFNFNADTGAYHIRVLYAKGKEEGNTGFEAGASVFDNNNEAGAVSLSKAAVPKDEGGTIISALEGALTFKKEGVGTVSIKMPPPAGSKNCIAMYVMIYK